MHPIPSRTLLRALLVAAAAAVLGPRPLGAAPAPLAPAPDEARWLRYPAIAPDGSRIAFSYKGDLWLVPSAGGRALPVTTHAAQETQPVWSPDGSRLAYASDRHGNFDVFVLDLARGEERRLTFHSSNEMPTAFTPDGSAVLFTARRQDAPAALVPSTFLSELWSVPVAGGVPTQVLTTPAEQARPSPDGARLVYQDLRSYEDEWRKRHTSSAARNLWLHDRASGRHTRLTENPGEDRDPVWSPDGQQVHYLAERAGGTFNVWSMPLSGDGGAKAVTTHTGEPVRFLSIARDGTLCYAWQGGLWLRAPGGAESRRVPVVAAAGDRSNGARREVLTEGATDMAVNGAGDTVAFVMRGEVFVASVKHGTTRRVTDSPSQERSVAWSKDGETLYYAAERGGGWNLYATTLAHPEEKHFFRATGFVEKALLATPAVEFQPLPSPDGRLVAYVQDRDSIAVLDVAAGTTRTLAPSSLIYSYEDGDVELAWSPDSRWLAFTCNDPGRWIGAVAVADVTTGAITNVTRSGYQEGSPRWSPDGRTLLFVSDRFGQRSHASWGSEDDVLALYLTRAARERARLSEEEYELLRAEEEEAEQEAEEAGDDAPAPGGKGGEKPAETKDGKKDGKKEGKQGGAEDASDEQPVPPVEIELERLDERVARLTPHSLLLGPYLMSHDGETLVYTGKAGEAWHLFAVRPRADWAQRLTTLGEEAPTRMAWAEDGTTAFVLDGDGRILKVDLGGVLEEEPSAEGVEPEPVEYAAEMVVRSPEERAYMFEHVVDQVARKFYDPALHGVDWPATAAVYRAYLPHVTTGHDFAELLSEMLGELNASHTGAGYKPEEQDADDKTAGLGLLYDVTWAGPGAKVAEVLLDGPADRPASALAAGVLLTHVDGVALDAQTPLEALLNRKAGRRVRLRLVPAAGGAPVEEVLTAIPLAQERALLYERWVRRCRALTDRLSGGRVGYVHVESMDDESFRRLYREALGQHGTKEALVVDTRFNGGGWIHDDLIAFLQGRDYVWFQPRGKRKGDLGAEPHDRWSRPVVVLQSEANYSDAHMFPYAFKALGLGKLVGMPVAGTGTAVWWEEQIDPTIVFGIPQVGMLQPDGRFLENTELPPDIRVEGDPAATARGEDPQLEAAVRDMLQQLGPPR